MYFVYIVRCNDGSLYTGIAKDLKKRIAEHNGSDLAAKYTRSRRPVAMVFCDKYGDRSSALKAEINIKKLSKEEKLKMIEKWNTK